MTLAQFLRGTAVAAAMLCTAVANATVISFSPGVAIEDNGATQTLLLQTSPSSLSNQYVSSDDWHSVFVSQLFLGKDFYQNATVRLRSGLTLGYVDNARINGIVNQLALSGFDNLSYDYSVQSFSAMASLKAYFLKSRAWQPYLSGGIGLANNHSHDYREIPLISGAVPMAAFSDRSVQGFAYSLGAGVMHPITKHFSMGVGYEFVDLGKVKLGKSSAQDTSEAPGFKHFLLQQWLLHFCWNF